jgi:hypothetical protein
LDEKPIFEATHKSFHFLTAKASQVKVPQDKNYTSGKMPHLARLTGRKVLPVRSTLNVDARTILLPNSDLDQKLLLSLHITPDPFLQNEIEIDSIVLEANNAVISQLDSEVNQSQV